MSGGTGRGRGKRRAGLAGAVRWLWPGLLLVAVAGCQTASYYGQAIRGQYQILRRERPIARLLADPATPGPLRAKLQLVLKLRAFAGQHLDLPVDRHYLRYADLGRAYVVWDVYAAPEFSLTPVSWWYPIAGTLTYRGYFSEESARRYAARLRAKGYDVAVDGVVAYSTLGWFRDPVLNTFIHDNEADVAETLFHELAHQRLFVGGDTDFDEAFATAVGEEGVRRWFAATTNRLALAAYATELGRHAQVIKLILETRRRLQALYASNPRAREDGVGQRAPPGLPWPRPGVTQPTSPAAANPSGWKRRRKAEILDAARAEYDRLKAQWGGDSKFDRSFGKSLNNAQLNAAATYYRFVPAFDRLLRAHHGNLRRFYRAVAILAGLPKASRHRRLEELLAARARFSQSEAPALRPFGSATR